ncbi:MAG: GtrA family protein [Christensenellales bacterium]
MKRVRRLYERHKQIINYLIFGAATTLVNWIVYGVLVRWLQVDLTLSNVVAWAASVIFAFVTNKIWVFESKRWKWSVVAKESISFLGSRLASGVVEIGLFPVLVGAGLDQKLFGIDGFAAKLIVSVIVIILNYVFSKFIVFRKKACKQPEQQLYSKDEKR